MKAFTKKTGWVYVIKDVKSMLCFWLAVPGYTFYFASYQEILAIEKGEGQCGD